jgi:hypothetical protein
MTHRPTLLPALLAFALLCLVPTALLAHSRPRKKAVLSSHSKRDTTTHKRHVTREKVSLPQGRSHRKAHTIVASAPHRIAPAPVEIRTQPTPEVRETGISHPPDLNDVGPSSHLQLPEMEEVDILPALYNKRGRLIMPPPMKGSHEILVHQNEVAERDGLERIQDDSDLERMRRLNMLVPLPVSAGLQVDDRLPLNRRYSRPWTAQFLATMARAHYARFHTALQVNSAVRTVEFQQRLIRTNGNAAPAQGETASPHLTGQAVDLAKHGLSLSEIAWMRGYLLPLVQEGKIDVEEEFQQSCFHISVYRKYLPPASVPRRNIASTHRDSPAGLAIAIP